ncbi:FYVE, RhoGEF and PH domain-containing protein 2 [Pleurodeles waltl]|uniref:FYVE, RhoGEF and PH domain-containing protein 2 n=1 Tax=Pleurodeles waltl TaxID=8319 RepID=UPI0037099DC4
MEGGTMSKKTVLQITAQFEEESVRPTCEESDVISLNRRANGKAGRSPGSESVSGNPLFLKPLKNLLPTKQPLQPQHSANPWRKNKSRVEEEAAQRAAAAPSSENPQPGSEINGVHNAEEQPPQQTPPLRRSLTYLSALQAHMMNLPWRLQGPDQITGEHGIQDPEEKKIVSELLETERAYVSRLHLLDQLYFSELLTEAQTKKTFPEDVVKLIFSNIASIHQFHELFFLPEIEQRLGGWVFNPRIGDIIQKLAPFLKMYTVYIKNFDKAMKLINLWREKCQPFQDIIMDIEKREVSASLSLCHHMLEPVQRIPRYELLLKEYLHKLPPQSQDRADTEKALELISSAAKHSNAAIAEMDRLRRLWEVYKRLGIEEEFVDPSNELIKEGAVQKISLRRSSSTTERYLFLFNNMLLYCMPKVIQVGAEYQVRLKIDVNGMKVKELKDAEFPHAFLISGKQRTLELQARSPEEADSWIQACQDAINQNRKRNESFKPGIQVTEGKLEELGRRAPQWIRDNLVTLCMRCKEPFHPIMRRRHHCRACGYVVCAKCSDYKAELMYDPQRLNRVCLACFTFLTGGLVSSEHDERKPGILEKESAEVSGRSLVCSFLQLLDKGGKAGLRSWCVIPKDEPLILYMFAAPQDVKAHTSIPLLGYMVKDVSADDSRHLFQLAQSGQLYTFLAESEELKQSWLSVLTLVVTGNIFMAGDEDDSPDETD